MGLVCFDPVIAHIHGRATGSSQVVLKHRNASGINFSSALPVSKKEPTPAVTAAREKFTRAMAQVAAEMADETKLAAYKTAFQKQLRSPKAGCKNAPKYTTLRGFVTAEVYKTLG